MNLNLTLRNCTALFAIMLAVPSYGQAPSAKTFGKQHAQPCASTEYEALLQKKYPNRAGTAQFEQWLAPKVEAAKAKRLQKNSSGVNDVIIIPVVVHVIHNGDALGTNENISEEQILSQITVLNQDFRRMLGTNGYNENPVGADIQVEFCLAQRDPDGFASNGITRHNIGNDFGFSMEEVEALIKPQTQWDPEQYLNIWTVNYMYLGFGQLLGYAQFPVQSGLDGLTNPGMPTSASTDGVAVTASCFGSQEIYPEGTYSPLGELGRTATHEVGHYLGLRHIWGDGGCNVDDYCADTPVTGQANSGCESIDSCPSSPGEDMIENYMDYTDDSCRSTFTQDQKDRIMAVLENSPRRSGLAASLACTPGNRIDNDGSLELYIDSACSNAYTPTIALRNTGNNIITAAAVNYSVNGQAAQTYNWTGSLAIDEVAMITLPQTVIAPGNHTFSSTIATVNSAADTHTENNSQTADFKVIRNHITENITVTVNTDDWGGESMWILVDSNQEAVEMGGGDYGNNQTYETTIAVDGNQCYTFIMIDIAGDGFEEGGSYVVTGANNDIIAQGSQFGITDITGFGIDITLGTTEAASLLNGITLYPNPASGIINIAMPNAELPESITIYNSLGQVMDTVKVTSAANLSITTSSYSNGIYFIKIEKGGQAQTLKFVKK